MALRATGTQRVPLPDPRVQATKLLPKVTPHDDVEVYHQMFEKMANSEGWHPDDWAREGSSRARADRERLAWV